MDLHRFQHLFRPQPSCALRSRVVTLDERDRLQTHIIEAFPSVIPEPTSLPLILLIHGFPELAFSWRKVLAPLSTSREGYHVVAPDLRGFGHTITTPNQIQYGDPIAPFHLLNIAKDIHALVSALGHSSVSMIVGHDFGSLVAGYCVTAYPDIFRSVVFMSAPFTGIERPQKNPNDPPTSFATTARAVSAALAALTPSRNHYTAYLSGPDANEDLLGNSLDDLYTFLGGYYYFKSGAWPGNTTHPLSVASDPSPTIDAIVRDLVSLPEYYIMPAHESMRQVVDRHVRQDAHCTWPQDDVEAGRVYADEFGRTGFQGGLNYYRSVLSPPPAEHVDELIAISGQRVTLPAAFISGGRDWGVFQTPGALEKMRVHFGMQDEDVVLIEGAGHWVQQETPDRVIAAFLQFLSKIEGHKAV